MTCELIDIIERALVASTWLGDHQARPSAPTNSLHKLHMARYQVHQLTITITTNKAASPIHYRDREHQSTEIMMILKKFMFVSTL